MLPSHSTGALTNRLIPENKINPNLYSSNSSASLRPKILNSKSTSQLHPPGDVGVSKVNKLRLEVGQNTLNTKTLSNSASAQILSPDSRLRTASPTKPVKDLGLLTAQLSEFSLGSTNIEARDGLSTGERLELTQPPKHNTFIGSLDLTAQQLHDLFKVPQTFFYLRCRENGNIGQDIGSVYDLEVVSLDYIDKNFYFTLSKEGVTQFRNKVSSFTSLSQWEREYHLFHKIAQINFFRVYKRWKVNIILYYFSIYIFIINIIFFFSFY